MAKSVIEYIAEDKYNRYLELVELANKRKAEAPKEKKPRGPMTAEQKIKMQAARVKSAEEKLARLLAEQEAAMENAQNA